MSTQFQSRDPKLANVYSLSKDGDKPLSPHFRVREFRCKDGSDAVIIHPDLVLLLESIRVEVGHPITINSGYRTKTYNAAIGGAKKSFHVLGMAADIVCRSKSPAEIFAVAEGLGAGGIHAYPSFTHVDCGPSRRW